mmetsp:Transcript_137853/g.326617  ORF Transcript_137853/g.326617 Transcript_137853/m.326617 type:complete len:174 (+) Transcript_137853:118-639(+)
MVRVSVCGVCASAALLLWCASASPSLRGNETKAAEVKNLAENLTKASSSAMAVTKSTGGSNTSLTKNGIDYLTRFEIHQYTNCYRGNGGTLTTLSSGYMGRYDTVAGCARECYEHSWCFCFVWQSAPTDAGEWSTSRNNCWLRNKCDINSCQRGPTTPTARTLTRSRGCEKQR